MAQVLPFYCLQQLVHHANDDCPQAQSILPADRRVGRGGKTECLGCRNLNKTLLKKSRSYGIMRRLIASTIPLT